MSCAACHIDVIHPLRLLISQPRSQGPFSTSRRPSATHAPHLSHLMFSTFSFSFEGLRVNWDCQRIVLGFLLLHGIYYHCAKVRNISLISFQLTVDFVSTNSLLHVNCFHQGTPPMWVCLFSQKDNLKCLFTVAIKQNFVSNVNICSVKFQNDFIIDRVLVGASICDTLTQWPPIIFKKKCLRNILCENTIIYWFISIFAKSHESLQPFLKMAVSFYGKMHCLTSEFHVKFHAKNRYRTNREVKFNVEFTRQAEYFSWIA